MRFAISRNPGEWSSRPTAYFSCPIEKFQIHGRFVKPNATEIRLRVVFLAFLIECLSCARQMEIPARIGDVVTMPEGTGHRSADDERVFEGYRRWGYLAANLDPLGFLAPYNHPELIVDGAAVDAARNFYCGAIGAEFAHI